MVRTMRPAEHISGDHMALHPQIAAALKAMEAMDLPALNTQTPEAARAAAKGRPEQAAKT